MREAASN